MWLGSLAVIIYKFFGNRSFIETPLPLVAVTMFFTGVI